MRSSAACREWSRHPHLRRCLAIVMTLAIAYVSGTGCARREQPRREVELRPKPAHLYPGPPTVTVMTLAYESGKFELLKASDRRDSIRPLDLPAHADALRRGEEALFDYRVLDAHGRALTLGSFILPLSTELVYERRGSSRRIVHGMTAMKRPITDVVIPFNANSFRIEFTRVLPSSSDSLSRWERAPGGSIEIHAKGGR
jgi:hypothetical protein